MESNYHRYCCCWSQHGESPSKSECQPLRAFFSGGLLSIGDDVLSMSHQSKTISLTKPCLIMYSELYGNYCAQTPHGPTTNDLKLSVWDHLTVSGSAKIVNETRRYRSIRFVLEMIRRGCVNFTVFADVFWLPVLVASEVSCVIYEVSVIPSRVVLGQSMSVNFSLTGVESTDPFVGWVHEDTATNGKHPTYVVVLSSDGGCQLHNTTYGGVIDICDRVNHVYSIRFPSVTTKHNGEWYTMALDETPETSEHIEVVVLGECHNHLSYLTFRARSSMYIMVQICDNFFHEYLFLYEKYSQKFSIPAYKKHYWFIIIFENTTAVEFSWSKKYPNYRKKSVLFKQVCWNSGDNNIC